MWDSGVWMRWFLAWAVGFMLLTIVGVTFIVSELMSLSRANADLVLKVEALRQSASETKNRVDVIYDVLLRAGPTGVPHYDPHDPRRLVQGPGAVPPAGSAGIQTPPAQGLLRSNPPANTAPGAAMPGQIPQTTGLFPRAQSLQSLTQPVTSVSEIRVLGVRPLGNGGRFVSIEVLGQVPTPGWEGPMLTATPASEPGVYAFAMRALPPTGRLPSAPSQMFATTGIEIPPGLEEIVIRVQGRNNAKSVKVDL